MFGTGDVMDLAAEAPVSCRPYRFVTRRGRPVRVAPLEGPWQGRLVDAYLAYRPRSCFRGLPVKDAACEEWGGTSCARR